MARRRQAVTIRHVADDAGVSLQTVSRVINKEPNVRPAMKEKVQASIDKLGYVPSIAAQRMSGSRSYLILALNDRERTIEDWRARQGTDWVDQMLLGGMLTCAEHGYRMMVELVDTHSDHVERELSGAIAALQPDGVILTPPHSENPLITGLLANKNIPFARIGSREAGPGICLTMDDERSSAMATEKLIELGHRRIGFIAGPDDYSLSGWRVNGWQAAMQFAGLETNGLCIKGDFGFDSGVAAARQLLSQSDRPSAIIASSDQMALATLEVAREFGLAVPLDLSLISFDNTPIVRFTNPPLTAVDQPIAQTISRAVELLINSSKAPLPSEPINVEGKLEIRGSTGPARRANDI
ncbi:LacI family DNA-binding transcriptional regulator [Altererythrobacter sp.]|uniref:LacI family DNA-binding transcriptional regulator n=1 Tax=Altererythrobacter sp. TaxID=1872480 RepID=UPI001B2D5281|nr:LacI family DNA-binding transcriptional regulator [Altererythrobacter sp.]MBO6609476.1 LacI family DNA-binding transcriptional regulator [Altererythrobacter sp.]MBO6642343.1 LacI family DNA-binding transcriptional regulator [Altererythrobacter sp.]MBO6709149.1 LacI family DNA-binding transcriptional regulator [Altererythrobacter sp.]